MDDLHEMLLSVAQWSAEEQTLEIDGKEVAKAHRGTERSYSQSGPNQMIVETR